MPQLFSSRTVYTDVVVCRAEPQLLLYINRQYLSTCVYLSHSLSKRCRDVLFEISQLSTVYHKANLVIAGGCDVSLSREDDEYFDLFNLFMSSGTLSDNHVDRRQFHEELMTDRSFIRNSATAPETGRDGCSLLTCRRRGH